MQLLINAIAIFSIFISGCAGKFKPDFCDIVNVDTLACSPTDPGKEKYDLPTIKALGYRCVSPEDWREGKKRIRKVLEVDTKY